MATTTVYIQQDNATTRTAKMRGDPSAGGTKGYYFGDGDTLQLTIDTGSFAAGTVFKTITFYPTTDESSTSGSVALSLATISAGRQTIGGCRTLGAIPTNMFTVSWTASDRKQPVSISDIENATSDDCAWFSVVVTDPSGNDWTMDPELVNTSGGTPSGWTTARAATMAQMVAV